MIISSTFELLSIDGPTNFRSSIADQTDALAKFAREKLGRLDIWVNNAGISQQHKSKLQNTAPAEVKEVLDTNLLGSIYGARAALKVSHPCAVSSVLP